MAVQLPIAAQLKVPKTRAPHDMLSDVSEVAVQLPPEFPEYAPAEAAKIRLKPAGHEPAATVLFSVGGVVTPHSLVAGAD